MATRPAKCRLLVASPGLADPNFHRAVVYLLEHDEGGSVGVVLNRPTDTPVDDVVPRWGLVVAAPPLVFGGGPVSVNGAICLARMIGDLAPREVSADGLGDDQVESSFQRLSGSLGTVDLHRSPEEVPVRLAEARVFAGYAGWSAGQLEEELDERAWVVVEADESDVFDTDPDGLWARVLRRQGGWLSVLARHPLDPSVN